MAIWALQGFKRLMFIFQTRKTLREKSWSLSMSDSCQQIFGMIKGCCHNAPSCKNYSYNLRSVGECESLLQNGEE